MPNQDGDNPTHLDPVYASSPLLICVQCKYRGRSGDLQQKQDTECPAPAGPSTPESSTWSVLRVGILLVRREGCGWNLLWNSAFALCQAIQALGKGSREAVQEVPKVFPSTWCAFDSQL